MSHNNTIKGSARQGHVTRQGIYLERSYIYLEPFAWRSLYAAAEAAEISTSQYIATLLAANGTSEKGLNNDSACN